MQTREFPLGALVSAFVEDSIVRSDSLLKRDLRLHVRVLLGLGDGKDVGRHSLLLLTRRWYSSSVSRSP